MSEKKFLNVMYQSDNNFAVFMGVSITSLLENNKNHNIHLYIIDVGISEENKRKLNDLTTKYGQTIKFFSADKLLKEMQDSEIAKNGSFRKNKTSFCKMFFEKLICCDDIEKMLYIDCDTIINGDLSSVLDVDMGSNSIGMVQDALISTLMKEKLGFGINDKYYNSGVILFDVNNWINNKCSDRIFQHAAEGHVYGTVDQDYLNVVLKDEITTLDICWNVQLPYYLFSLKTFSKVFKKEASYYSTEEIENGLQQKKVIHFLKFCGESPWTQNSIHPATDLFDTYLEISPWNDYEKMPTRNMAYSYKIEKILYKILPHYLFCIAYKLAHNRMIKNSNKA